MAHKFLEQYNGTASYIFLIFWKIVVKTTEVQVHNYQSEQIGFYSSLQFTLD